MSLTLYIDIQNKKLLKTADGPTLEHLPPFYYGSKIEIVIVPRIENPEYSRDEPYVEFDWTGYSFTMEVGASDADDTTSPVAFCEDLTVADDGLSVSGLLDLFTDELKALIGSKSQVKTYFEIKSASPTDEVPDVVLQIPILVHGVVYDPDASTTPVIPIVVTEDTDIVANRAYIPNSTSVIEFRTPATIKVGAVFSVTGRGSGGWKISQRANQIIHFNGQDLQPANGNGIQSSLRYDTVGFRCIVENEEFVVDYFTGSITTFAPSTPTYLTNAINSLPTVRFAYDKLLDVLNDSTLFGVNLSIFAVLRFQAQPTGSTTWMLQKNPGGPYSFLFGGTSSGPTDQMAFYAGTSDPSHVVSSFNIPDGTAFLAEVIYDGAVNFAHNSTSDGNGTPLYGTPTGDLVDNGGTLTIGNMVAFGGDSSNQVDISELLIYTNAVSSGNRDSIRSYLSNKWGIGSGTTFNPSTVSGLGLWLKADAITGLSNGDRVRTWLDSSGNNNNAIED
jgi:hypothetical protein